MPYWVSAVAILRSPVDFSLCVMFGFMVLVWARGGPGSWVVWLFFKYFLFGGPRKWRFRDFDRSAGWRIYKVGLALFWVGDSLSASRDKESRRCTR